MLVPTYTVIDSNMCFCWNKKRNIYTLDTTPLGRAKSAKQSLSKRTCLCLTPLPPVPNKQKRNLKLTVFHFFTPHCRKDVHQLEKRFRQKQ